ncbi:TniB family NTP-binding protein [Pseudomonas umsongensis]|uniref:TniB family NTP-binding protein n=1 Tax=Pseudomonas umsongensis TaxID=198618 RepID=UPI001CDD623E|nr:TniB family NTP-binding protein [Pseudomonas umsongensis]
MEVTSYTHVHHSRHHLFELDDEERMFACAIDFWVPHPDGEKIISRVKIAMRMNKKTVAPCMLVTAPGGGGKTALIDELKHRNLQFADKLLFVTMHQSPNGYSLRDLILLEMGLGVGRRARQGENITPLMQHMIKTQNIRGIVIDEVHDALTLTEVQQRINLSLLKNLSGSTYGLSVFAFGVPAAAAVLRRDPQLARRYAVHSMTEWKNGKDFRSFVGTYITMLPLKRPTNFKDQNLFLKIMHAGQGITDNIVKVLQASAMMAIMDGSECITHRHLDNIESIMSEFSFALRDAEPEGEEAT